MRENKLLYSSYLPLGVPNELVIHHAQGPLIFHINLEYQGRTATYLHGGTLIRGGAGNFSNIGGGV
jgi:hypothetical protein